ncbi:DUF4998 domain-containing protein [Parabacteroides pacaensis]|uniref:DUF4998 domain-containing protein n=1 Tax=Parabacteroides pacaensis TaxID=2086575 RepID=UPI000D100FF2|nr:DUF4998 domain-containing protein [Parabacteroides pacaensis]
MKQNYINLFLLCTLLLGLANCDGMDATYKDFLKDGEIVYAGITDSVKFYPGRNRAKLSFYILDPSVVRTRIYWNNQSDSIELTVDPLNHPEPYFVEITNLKEGSYSFDLYTFSENNNSSMKVNIVGRVYGNEYENSLLNTPMKGAYALEDNPDDFEINWGSPDLSAIGSEVVYTDKEGKETTVFAPSSDKTTLIRNYRKGTNFLFRTLFLPEETAIDTFMTQFNAGKVKGIAVEYDKKNWEAYGEDYDRGNVRPPKNTIDNNINTVWHMDKNSGYPHSMRIDMKEELRISGFTFMQRLPLDGAINQIEMRASHDGEEWVTIGEFFLQNVTTWQFVDLNEDVTCRYFELIVKSDYKGGRFTALAEIGTYAR